MDTYQLILQRRSIRKFQQKPLKKALLEKMVNAARLAPCGANLQPLEYIVITDKESLNQVFATTRWAAYLSPQGTPKEDERPVAYIIVLINRKARPGGGQHDSGAAIMNIILTALEEGVGSCWIGSIERNTLRAILSIPEIMEIDSIVALGYPAENPVTEELTDSVKYWQDESGTLHVPKRSLQSILHWERFE